MFTIRADCCSDNALLHDTIYTYYLTTSTLVGTIGQCATAVLASTHMFN